MDCALCPGAAVRSPVQCRRRKSSRLSAGSTSRAAATAVHRCRATSNIVRSAGAGTSRRVRGTGPVPDGPSPNTGVANTALAPRGAIIEPYATVGIHANPWPAISRRTSWSIPSGCVFIGPGLQSKSAHRCRQPRDTLPKRSRRRFAKHVRIPRESDADEFFTLTAVVPEKMIPREDKHAVLTENPLELQAVQRMIDPEPGHAREKRPLTGRRGTCPATVSV